MLVTVWASDTWLKEHAGATLEDDINTACDDKDGGEGDGKTGDETATVSDDHLGRWEGR